MVVKLLPAAAIFDMDGVLVDSEPLHIESYVRAFDEYGTDLSHEHYRQKIALGHHSVPELFSELDGNMDCWHELSKRKAELLKELIAEKLKLMPGIVELLKILRESDIPVALATSAGRSSLELIMEKFDLRPYFKIIITWEDVGAIKPDPQAYIVAAQRLGVKPKECVVFEDSPRGVLAAHRAGAKCIAIPTSTTYDGDFSRADLMIDSLAKADLKTLRDLFDESVQSCRS